MVNLVVERHDSLAFDNDAAALDEISALSRSHDYVMWAYRQLASRCGLP